MRKWNRAIALLLAALMLPGLAACDAFGTHMARAVQKMSRLDNLHFALSVERELSLSAAEPGKAAAPEPEAAEKDADLYDLWDYGAESMTWVTSGVPVTDGVLLVSAAALPESTEHLAVSDGNTVWEVKAVLPDSSGLVATVFFEPEGKELRYGFWHLLPYGQQVQADTCILRSGDALGSRINHRVLDASSVTWRDTRCLLLTLEDSVPLGSAVLTAEGELAGIVVGFYAEGGNRVLAMPPEELARCMTEASMALGGLPGWGNPAEGFRVTADKNFVTIDWKDMTLPEKKENDQ